VTEAEFIVEATGPQSPAKLAVIRRAKKAAAERAKKELSEALADSKNTKEIAEALTKSSGGNSPIALAISKTKTNKDILKVLKICKDDEEMAHMLSDLLLKAKTPDDVSDAFSNVYIASVS